MTKESNLLVGPNENHTDALLFMMQPWIHIVVYRTNSILPGRGHKYHVCQYIQR